MDSPTTTMQDQTSSSAHTPTIQVNFQWKKWKACVTDINNPSEPLYIIDYRTIRSPHLIFTNAVTNETVGTGTLHGISIHAKYELHGEQRKLQALKRFKTQYTHLSYIYSDTETPVPMTWASSCGFATWDFICLDENQNPVAKFAANAWKLKKVGNIEFLGPKASDRRFQEEILVTGMTLYNCMLLRVNNIFSLFGAIVARTGPLEVEGKAIQDSALELDDDVQHARLQTDSAANYGTGNKPVAT